MDEEKKRRLQEAGWVVGNAQDFLGLSDPEAAYVEMRVNLGTALREARKEKSITQKQLASRLGSSQSRVAKMEAGDSSVSLDLLVRSLLDLGSSRQDVARALCKN